MPCDTQTLPNETVEQRKATVRETVATLARKLADGSARVVVGPQGAIAFTGLSASERNRVTDACLYRRIMVSGSAIARARIAQAERLAGRSVSRQVIGQGAHSHDGGASWHDRKG